MNTPDAIDLSYFVDGIFTNFEETFDVDASTLTEQRQEWITVAEMKQGIIEAWPRDHQHTIYSHGYHNGAKAMLEKMRETFNDLSDYIDQQDDDDDDPND